MKHNDREIVITIDSDTECELMACREEMNLTLEQILKCAVFAVAHGYGGRYGDGHSIHQIFLARMRRINNNDTE